MMGQEIFSFIGLDDDIVADMSFENPPNCPLLNVSMCHFTEENDRVLMTVYNSLPRTKDIRVKLPVRSSRTVKVIKGCN